MTSRLALIICGSCGWLAGPTGAIHCGPLWSSSRTEVPGAFYRAHAPRPVPVAELARVAGTRWKIEESFAGGKELTALDEHQIRGWTSWRRWTVLAMLAHAFLSVLTASQPTPKARDHAHDQSFAELIPLTHNEIRRIFAGLTARLESVAFRLDWSVWRRHHQAVARACHFKRRAEQVP